MHRPGSSPCRTAIGPTAGSIDLEAVGAACRRVGAALCIDATQSVGALPLDVKRIDPDFVAVASYKWLLGPYSLGFLYVAPRRQGGRPIEHNWMARRDSEDFAGLVNYKDEFQAGARRFDVGERSNFALMPVVEASLKLIAEWTVPRIHATLSLRTNAIAERARAELGIGSVPSHRRAGHYLGLRFAGGIPPELPARLAANKVYVSVRGQAMRVTPHLWNTDEDVEKLFAVLRTVHRDAITRSNRSSRSCAPWNTAIIATSSLAFIDLIDDDVRQSDDDPFVCPAERDQRAHARGQMPRRSAALRMRATTSRAARGLRSPMYCKNIFDIEQRAPPISDLHRPHFCQSAASSSSVA